MEDLVEVDFVLFLQIFMHDAPDAVIEKKTIEKKLFPGRCFIY